MATRMHDTEIWDEDWFIDLPNDYKLFYLYIKDKCDHSGLWRPNRRKFEMCLQGKKIFYDDFLTHVNKDPEHPEKPKKRVVILPNGRWFITRFISFQLGGRFVISIGAHRGALKLLISNDVHPSEVPGIDWCGIENYDMQYLKEIGHGKGLYRLSLGETYHKHRDIEREKEPEQEKYNGKGGVGEKPIFKLQALYDKQWGQFSLTERDFKGITEQSFMKWKEFVDWVIANGYEELFRAIFVNPSDFNILYTSKGFIESAWEPVVKKMLSTGIKPEQNLYFRIPDFMKYAKIDINQSNKGTGSMNAGTSNHISKQEKW